MAPSKLGIGWHDVSRLLGSVSSGESLPARTSCPLCHKDRFSIYQNSTNGSDWGYCFDCKFGGDMIELAAAVWNMPIHDTIKRLAYEGMSLSPESLTEASIAAYVKSGLERQKRVLELWQRSQQFLVCGASPTISNLRRHFGLLSNFSRERMLRGPAKLFGATTAKAVQAAIYPWTATSEPRSDVRMFRGRGWRDVLVIPFFGAPQQITSFYVVGRKGKQEDRVMLPIFRPVRETGLAGLEALLELQSSYVIALSDPLLLLRLQMRNFNASLRPLPLVAWYVGAEGTTDSSWSSLSGRRVVHWGGKLTASLLLQSRRTDGDLVLAGPQTSGERAMAHYVRLCQPMDLVKRLVASAKPWREAFVTWLRNSPESEVLVLTHQLEAAGCEIDELLEECGARRLAVARKIMPQVHRCKVGQDWVTERGERWYTGKKGDKLLLNAIIRIQHVVLRGKNIEYYGFLRIAGKDVNFRYKRHAGHVDCFLPFLERTALDAGHQLYWSRMVPLARIAMAFHEPTIVKGKVKVGWTGRGFRFKHFTMKDGQLRTHDDWLLPPDCPGYHASSVSLGKDGVKLLNAQGPEAEWTWAITTSLLSAVLAPAVGQEGPRTLITGSDALTVASRLLGLCGVPERRLHKSCQDYRIIMPIKWPHNWPLCVHSGERAGVPLVHRWLISSGFPGVVHAAADELSAQVLLCHDGFLTISFPENFSAKACAQMPTSNALMCYLRAASGRLGKIEHDSRAEAGQPQGLWRAVQADLAAWFESVGGDGSTIRACDRMVRFSGDPQRFDQIAEWLYRKGFLRPSGRFYKRAAPVDFDARGVLVPKATLVAGLKMARLPEPDLTECPELLIISRAKLSS